MSWSIGYDSKWKRDIGYGVPAICDHPGCGEKIDRGLAYVCGGEPYGGEGCGLYFCANHRSGLLCSRCANEQPPFSPAPDHPEWIKHKLTDESWQAWRDENPKAVAELSAANRCNDCAPEFGCWDGSIACGKLLPAASGSVRQSGWVILHPNGRMELNYFNSDLSYNKYDGPPLTREQWMQRYRPGCTLHRGEISITLKELAWP